MSKVLTKAKMNEAAGQREPLDLEELVAPSADDLLDLTQAALGDIDPPLWMSNSQREQLRLALRARLASDLISASARRSAAFAPKPFSRSGSPIGSGDE
ncbi:MAG: hypothetical protein AAF739_00520 [Pseudomonadota bacterium]